MDTKNSENFNDRLNQWIANQGFWFQLRHSLVAQGQASVFTAHMLKLLIRAGLFVTVVALGFGFYLWKRVDSPKFQNEMLESMRSAFAAEQVEIKSFRRLQGKAMIRRIGIMGGEKSFFDSLEASNLRLNMGLMDGTITDWQAGTIEVDECHLELRPGMDSEAAVEVAVETLFGTQPGFEMQGIDVESMHMSWGYFERAFGRISGSHARISRIENGWRMRFEGGTFTQNWLRNLELKEMLVLLKRDGLVIERAVMGSGDGSVVFRDVRVTGGMRPELSGELIFDQMPLKSLIPENAQQVVSGTISGDFRLGGSINSVDGVKIEGDAYFDGVNQIVLRDRLRLLNALDVVDPFRSYRKVVFNQGAIHLKTSAGRLVLSEIDLEADNLMAMTGEITIQRPKMGADAMMAGALNDSENQARDRDEDLRIGLRQAAELSSNNQQEGLQSEVDDAAAGQFFESLAQDREMRRLIMERELASYRFGGEVVLSLPKDAFDRSSRLMERYQPDKEAERIQIAVPLSGNIDEVTLDQAEEILNLGARG